MARESISELVNNKIHEAEIEFQRINVQEGFNEHYIHTFQLTNPTVVIVRYNQGQKSDHKVLNEVWRLSSQPVEFKKFIWSEVDKILSAENKMGAT
jgi:type VI protein secretion system component Hcp